MLVVGLENHRTTQSVSALIGVNSNNPKLLIKERRTVMRWRRVPDWKRQQLVW